MTTAIRRLGTVVAHATRAPTPTAPQTQRGRVGLQHHARKAVVATGTGATEPVAEMSAREKFLIDLNGFLVVPNVLTESELAALNAAADACWDSSYTDGGGEQHRCRQRGHQSAAFHEMRGMLEWPTPHCLPFRSLLTQPKMIPYMNSLHGRGWRLDHSPFMIIGRGAHGGYIHGHPWDPEYKYRYANGVMRSGHLAVAYQLTDVEKDWGGFGVIPGSHKCNFPLPTELVDTSLDSIHPPMVCPAAPKGSMLIFFESALHASLPWFGPPGTERRSLLFRIAPRHSSHRSGRGTHWGGTWTYEARQPSWVEKELTAEQQETLSAPRGNLASTFPAVQEGSFISGGALQPIDQNRQDGEDSAGTQLDYIAGRHGYRPNG